MNLQKNTKKRLTAALLAGLTLAVAAPALAASNPFSDVPAKHWAYDAVAKLAAAGIVDGYGDGTFRGDKTMTRFEMAQIVAKAMAHQDKANAEQKAMIGKLSQEFQDELDNLGVRVSTLEKKVGNITWTGQVREWYEWVDKGENQAGDSNRRTRLLLWANAPLTENLSFTGRFWAESSWGDTENRHYPFSNEGSGTGAQTSMDEAYLTYKHGNTAATLGRQPITLGKGLVYNMGPNNDGVTVTVGSKVKLTAAAFRSGPIDSVTDYDPAGHWVYYPGSIYWFPYSEWGQTGYNPNMIAANLAWQASKDLDFTLVYAKNKKSRNLLPPQFDPDWWFPLGDTIEGDAVNTWALGATYKGIKNVTVTAEYGRNNSDFAKLTHSLYTEQQSSSAADAWVAQIKYKGAQWDKPRTYGFWVGYRHADPGFLGVTGDPLWETPAIVPTMDNVKGFDYGFDYTVFKNGVFTFNYFDLESVSKGYYYYGNSMWNPYWNWVAGRTEYKSMIAQLRYFF